MVEDTVAIMKPTDPERMATLFLFALCLWREARGEPVDGRQAIADVILNRVADPRWPNSIVGVIADPWQFSAFNPHDPNAKRWPDIVRNDPKDWAAWVECWKIAEQKLAEGPALPGVDHYHSTAIRRPQWALKMLPVFKVGGHIFYTSKNENAALYMQGKESD